VAHAKFEEQSWKILELIAPDDVWFNQWGPSPLDRVEEQGDDLWRCACCNKKVSWRVVVESGTEVAVLGRACASKAALPGVPADAKAMKVEIAHRMINRDSEFTRWASALPHPKHRGRTLLDEARYWASRKPERVFEIMRRFRTEGPLPANDPKAPVALQLGKKGASRIEVRLGWTYFHRLQGKVWAAKITGTDPKWGLKREFVDVRERDADGRLSFLTDEPGVYQFNSARTRYCVELAADGSAKIVSEEDALAALQKAEADAAAAVVAEHNSRVVPELGPLADALAVITLCALRAERKRVRAWIAQAEAEAEAKGIWHLVEDTIQTAEDQYIALMRAAKALSKHPAAAPVSQQIIETLRDNVRGVKPLANILGVIAYCAAVEAHKDESEMLADGAKAGRSEEWIQRMLCRVEEAQQRMLDLNGTWK
jgi:hypothetical protein